MSEDIKVDVRGEFLANLLEENKRLQSEITTLSGKTGFCVQCEKWARDNERLSDAVKSVDIYFKALREQWAANDGRVVSESGVVLQGSKDVERLCDIAGMKVSAALDGKGDR